MQIHDHLTAEPMKYWAPPKTSTIIQDILAAPEKFSQYTFTQKFDGEWNKVVWDGQHVYMLARNRNVQGQFTDRWEKFPVLIEEIKKLPINTVLLGELAFPNITKTSKDVGSIMRSLVPRALKLQETDPLHFYVFDCLMWGGEDLSQKSYRERFMENDLMMTKLQRQKFIHLLSPQPMSKLLDYLSYYFKIGGEGVVLMDTNAKYAFNSRPSKISVKIKKQLDDFEAKVISTLDPTREYDGKDRDNWQYWEAKHVPTNSTHMCGPLHSKSMEWSYTAVTKPYYYGWKNAIRCTYEGREFSVASGLNDEDRAWLATSEAQELIKHGKLYAVVSAMEFTKDSVRHPYLVRLRTDI